MNIEETDAASRAVATSPRVSLADMEAKITARYDFTMGAAVKAMNMPGLDALTRFTVCVLVMQNGFMVIGKSAPASPENFDAELGMKFAYDDCIRQLWPLEGYVLRQRLSEGW